MPQLPPHPWIKVVELGDVTLFRIIEKRLRDEQPIHQLNELFDAAAEDHTRQKFVVNLAEVEVLSSAMVGKLIAFQKRLNTRGGRLALCGLSQGITRIFEIGGLRQIFQLCDNQAAAILAVAGPAATPLKP